MAYSLQALVPVVPGEREDERQAHDEQAEDEALGDFGPVKGVAEKVGAMTERQCGAQIAQAPLQDLVFFDPLPGAHGGIRILRPSTNSA